MIFYEIIPNTSAVTWIHFRVDAMLIFLRKRRDTSAARFFTDVLSCWIRDDSLRLCCQGEHQQRNVLSCRKLSSSACPVSILFSKIRFRARGMQRFSSEPASELLGVHPFAVAFVRFHTSPRCLYRSVPHRLDADFPLGVTGQNRARSLPLYTPARIFLRRILAVCATSSRYAG